MLSSKNVFYILSTHNEMILFYFAYDIDITNMQRTAMVTFFKNDRYSNASLLLSL